MVTRNINFYDQQFDMNDNYLVGALISFPCCVWFPVPTQWGLVEFFLLFVLLHMPRNMVLGAGWSIFSPFFAFCYFLILLKLSLFVVAPERVKCYK